MQWLGRFLGIILVFASPASYMLISSSFFNWVEVYSLDSSKMMGNFHVVFNFNRLFLILNRFSWNKVLVLPNRSFYDNNESSLGETR